MLNTLAIRAGAGAALALALVLAVALLGPGPEQRGGLALLGATAALALALLVPWCAAEGAADASSPRAAAAPRALALLSGIVGFALALALLAPSSVREDASATLGAALYLLLFAGLLWGCARAAGQLAATLLGLGALALPYLVGPLLDDASALRLVLHAPLAVLAGTFGEVDVLRQGTLYRVFPAAQALPYGYASPAAALGVGLAAVGLAWAPVLLGHARAARRRPARPGAAAVAALLLALLGAPGRAEAQLFPEPSKKAEGTGDMVTRVRLGYYLPTLGGYLRLQGEPEGSFTSRVSFRRHLDLDPAFVVPTLELDLSWSNAGGLGLQYMENLWHGETQTTRDLRIEEQTLRAGTVIDARYRYRTLALTGSLDVPVGSFGFLKILTTQRYMKHEVKIRGSSQLQQPFSMHNSVEAFAPVFGLGADVSVWNVISAYGDVQWLDFRSSVFGGEEERYQFKYREWKVGVRLELVKHAHVLLEYYSLETQVTDGKKERYQHELQGARLQVAVLF